MEIEKLRMTSKNILSEKELAYKPKYCSVPTLNIYINLSNSCRKKNLQAKVQSIQTEIASQKF